MPLEDDFDGTFNTVATLTVTTPDGSPVAVPIQGIENLTPPGRQHKKDTWTVISGTRSGKEQQALCSEQAATIEATLTYEKAHQLAIDAVVGSNGCAISLVLSDGLTIVGTGGIEKMSFARMEDSTHNSSEFTIALNAGWTMEDGGDNLTVPAHLVSMTVGTGSIDLTAVGSPVQDLTGYNVTRFHFTAPSTNAAAITIATGAVDGYTLASTIVLEPGDDAAVDIAPANYLAVATDVDTLDLSGTGTDGVRVFVAATPV